MSLDNFTKNVYRPKVTPYGTLTGNQAGVITNPSGTILSDDLNVQTKGGYSVHFIVTGSLAFTCTLYASNQDDNPVGTPKAYTSVANSTITGINNQGFMYDITTSNVGFIQIQIGTFTGTGTVQCYFTAKDI